ncbi:MAG: NAD(P)H-dependent oxidoreductase, partial [Comamonas sp.]
YPALLKNAIDWASSPVKGDALWSDGTLPFRNKVVGMASASPGGMGGLRAQSHLAPLLLNLQCWVAPRSHAVAHAADAFDMQNQLQRSHDQQAMQALVEQVLWAARRFQ